MTSGPLTMFEKIWRRHAIVVRDDGNTLLYVDRQMLHEGSFHAFGRLRERGMRVIEPSQTLAVCDHYVPTRRRDAISDPVLVRMLSTFERNMAESRIQAFGLHDPNQGIVHVVGPESGFTLPGLIVVCGDSHTSTHGALGALAFGIGNTTVAHVLATQTLWSMRPKTMRIDVSGMLAPGVTAKDLILSIIATIGTSGATGHVIEYTGEGVRALGMEGRLTVCNMSIEAGARAGMIAPDDVTYDYLRDRRYAPMEARSTTRSRIGARCPPMQVPHSTPPSRSTALASSPWSRGERARRWQLRCVAWCRIPTTRRTTTCAWPCAARSTTWTWRRARRSPISPLIRCSSARAPMAVWRIFARLLALHSGDARRVPALVVPGSGPVKREAEREGLDRIFRAAGFEWAEPGCSMCLGQNGDTVPAGKRCASTSNRNFRGRQGIGARTHLVSPPMAAAAALAGHFVDVRDLTEA